jgi:hypothetical protein
VNKFRKQYETAYAKLIRDGNYKPDFLSDMIDDRWLLTKKDQGLYRLCNEYLKALNQSGGDDPVFRAMLEEERNGVLMRLDEARTTHNAEMKERDEQIAADNLKRERDKRRDRERVLQARKKVEQAESAAKEKGRKDDLVRWMVFLFYFICALVLLAYIFF